MDHPSKFQASNGTCIEYLVRDNKSPNVVFWFSAFTQGPRLGKFLKTTPKFHGFKVSSENSEFSWVLIRDHAGYTNDGTYYGGKAGNLFIENAVSELIAKLSSEFTKRDENTLFIAMGSSMGGYAAMKFALLCNMGSCFVYSPHFDMRIAMQNCGRKSWIEWSLTDGTEQEKQEYLCRLQILLEQNASTARNTKVLGQATSDDPFVYPEQVGPFLDAYRSPGGSIALDLRDQGGHTSIHTPNEYIFAVLRELSNGNFPLPESLQGFPQRKYSRSEKIEKVLNNIEHLVVSALKILRIR